MISVCTSSTETQLARMADLLDMLGATASSCGMDKALTDATRWAERYITNSMDPTAMIRAAVYDETLAGSGGAQLMVSRVPLWAVQRFFDATDSCEANELCSTDFRIESAGAGFLTRRTDGGFAWDRISQQGISEYPLPAAPTRPWRIVYEAGYRLTEYSGTCANWVTTTTYRTLPEDIERAVLLKAAEFYQGGSVTGVTSMKVGPLAVNYGSEQMDEASSLLEPYRAWD